MLPQSSSTIHSSHKLPPISANPFEDPLTCTTAPVPRPPARPLNQPTTLKPQNPFLDPSKPTPAAAATNSKDVSSSPPPSRARMKLPAVDNLQEIYPAPSSHIISPQTCRWNAPPARGRKKTGRANIPDFAKVVRMREEASKYKAQSHHQLEAERLKGQLAREALSSSTTAYYNSRIWTRWAFWGALLMVQIGLVSASAAFAVVVTENRKGNDVTVGSGVIFWVVCSVAVLVVGGLASGFLWCSRSRVAGSVGLGQNNRVADIKLMEAGLRNIEVGNKHQPDVVQKVSPKSDEEARAGPEDRRWKSFYNSPEGIRAYIERLEDKLKDQLKGQGRLEGGEELRLMDEMDIGKQSLHRASPTESQERKPTSTISRKEENCSLPRSLMSTSSTINWGAEEVQLWSPLHTLERELSGKEMREMPVAERSAYINRRRLKQEERDRRSNTDGVSRSGPRVYVPAGMISRSRSEDVEGFEVVRLNAMKENAQKRQQ